MQRHQNTSQWFRHAICVLATFVLGTAAQAQTTPPTPLSKYDKSHQLQTLMEQYHATGQLDGVVLVADHGDVVYQGAFGLASREWKIPNTPDTAFRIASLTKQFTAALVMQLVDQGKVKLDDTIGMYVPELRLGIGDRVTIHQLLNHTSGIVDYANFPGFWENRLGAKVSRAEYMEIFNRDLEFAPGSTGKYNSSGYYLLGYVIEEVTRKPYELALNDMILTPLRMARSGYEAPERVVDRKATGYLKSPGGEYHSAAPMNMSNGYAAGGMFSTVGDLMQWDRALYGTQILSESAKQRMFTPYVKDDVRRDLGFGYGWMIGNRKMGTRETTVHEHGGNTNGFRSLITRFPADQRLIVILLNDGGGTITPAVYQMADSISKVLYDQPTTPPQRSLADALAQDIAQNGVNAAVDKFQQQRNAFPPTTGPNELNMLGYHYLSKGRETDAVEVFKLNIALFPKDGNGYDSLGEAYLNQGDKSRAKDNYKRAFELDSTNTNAVEMLRKLEQ